MCHFECVVETDMSKLSSDEIRQLDPYTLLAELGKKVIRPGGCGASETIFRIANFQPGQKVLDIGCGVGTTAIQIASRFGCDVTAVDVDSRMLASAEENIRKAGVSANVILKQGDIQALTFEDDVFDVVTIEAVSMFTRDQQAAIREAVRVCRPGGYVFDHEFVWTRKPSEELLQAFQTNVCSGMSFETEHEWEGLFRAAGQDDNRSLMVPFDLLTPGGMLRDEGLPGTVSLIARALSRWAYLTRVFRLMRGLARVSSCLSSVVVVSQKNKAGADNIQSGSAV